MAKIVTTISVYTRDLLHVDLSISAKQHPHRDDLDSVIF